MGHLSLWQQRGFAVTEPVTLLYPFVTIYFMKLITTATPTPEDIENFEFVECLMPLISDSLTDDDRAEFAKALNIATEKRSHLSRETVRVLIRIVEALTDEVIPQLSPEYWKRAFMRSLDHTQTYTDLANGKQRDFERLLRINNTLYNVVSSVSSEDLVTSLHE